MVKKDAGLFGEEQNSVSLKERLSKYFGQWPLFLACILLSVGAGLFYIRYSNPKFIANSSLLIVGPPISGDLIESTINGNVKTEVNLNNEILLMSSVSLMQRTVAKNGFNIVYFKKGRLLNLDIYKQAPFNLKAKELTDSNSTYNIYVRTVDTAGGTFSTGPDKKEKTYPFTWNQPLAFRGQSFVLSPNGPILPGESEYIAQWMPISAAARELSANLTIKAFDTKTNVLLLSIKIENLQRGKDVLDALCKEFNFSDIEDRNKLSEITVQFINDRLLSISGELNGVEGSLENYRGSNQLVDIKDQSTTSLANTNEVSKTIKELSIQKGIASMILEYFSNPANGSKLVPSSLGLNDGTLGSLITQYNELQLKKEREAPSLAPNSILLQDLNSQLANLRSSILESLNNINRNLQLQGKTFQQQNSQNWSYLSSVPHNERVLQGIKRKQTITEGLYLYLLQKREEAAISSTASKVSHYRQIDPASGFGPVEPNSRNIITYTALLGFFTAFGFVYLRSILNDKVVTKEDIVKRTSLPFLGQVSHISRKKAQPISVLERNVIGEQFRAIRTNLHFLLKDKYKNIIMVTSSFSGEGKSVTSVNLASVYAMAGKKVALLEFDTRRPVIGRNLQLDNPMGLTDYLTGRIKNISEICNISVDIPDLHIYLAGPIPLNHADLLLAENMNRLFDALKAEYDYIIIDSPPVEMVSDAFILGQYCDIVLFIIRSRVTMKKQLELVNNVENDHKFKQIAIILNDVRASAKYGYYEYGYEPKSSKKKSILGF